MLKQAKVKHEANVKYRGSFVNEKSPSLRLGDFYPFKINYPLGVGETSGVASVGSSVESLLVSSK